MKKLIALFALAGGLLLSTSPVMSQCTTPSFAAGTLCGNPTGSTGQGRPTLPLPVLDAGGATGTTGHKLPYLDGTNTWSAAQIGTSFTLSTLLSVQGSTNGVFRPITVRNSNVGSSAVTTIDLGNDSSTLAGELLVSSLAGTSFGPGGDTALLANTGNLSLRTTTSKAMTFYTNSILGMTLDTSQRLTASMSSTSTGVTQTVGNNTTALATTAFVYAADKIFNVLAYGATGNGVTDDTAAIQSAITAAQATITSTQFVACVYFPRPTSAYIITTTLLITKSLCIHGDGPAVSQLVSTQNIPYITVDTTAGEIFFFKMSGMGFTQSNGGAVNLEAGIKFIGANKVNYVEISDNTFYGVNIGIWGTTASGGSWSKIFANTCVNSGRFPDKCIWMQNGSFGSMVISNNVMGATTDVIRLESQGDTLIVGNQMNTATNCITVTSNTSVIRSMSNQCDAGPTNFYNLTSVNGFYAKDTMAARMVVTTPTGISIEADREETIAASITGSQNNYEPASFYRANKIILSSNGAYNITGFVAAGDAHKFCIYNISAFVITFLYNTTSTGPGGIGTNYQIDGEGTGQVMRPKETTCFQYNMSTTKWNITGQPENVTLASITSQAAGAIATGTGAPILSIGAINGAWTSGAVLFKGLTGGIKIQDSIPTFTSNLDQDTVNTLLKNNAGGIKLTPSTNTNSNSVTIGTTGIVTIDAGLVGSSFSFTSSSNLSTNANSTFRGLTVKNANAGSSTFSLLDLGNDSSDSAGEFGVASMANTTYGPGGDFFVLSTIGTLTLRTLVNQAMTFYTNSILGMTLSTSQVLNVVGGFSANGSVGLTRTCTIAAPGAGNTFTFTLGILTAVGASAGCV